MVKKFKKQNFLTFGSLVIVLFGALVVFGWVTDVPWLMPLSQNPTATPFFVGLSFLLIGLALNALETSRIMSVILGFVVFFIASVSLAQTFFSTNPYVQILATSVVPISPILALSFLMIGVSFMLSAPLFNNYHNALVIFVINAFIFGLSVAAIFGFTGIFARTNLYCALGLLTISALLEFWAWEFGHIKQYGRGFFLPIAVLLAGALFILFLWRESLFIIFTGVFGTILLATLIRLLQTTRSRERRLSQLLKKHAESELQLQYHADLLQLIFDTSNVINEVDEFEIALKKCLQIICLQLHWPVGHVYVPSICEPDLLIPTNIWHIKDRNKVAEFYNVIMVTNFSRGVGLPGRIWNSGRIHWIYDVSRDNNFPINILRKSVQVRGAVGIPIKVNQQVMAIFEFFSYEPKPEDENVKKIFAVLSEQLGRMFERKQAREKVKQAEQQTRLILQSAGEGIFGINRSGEVIFINKQAVRMLGYRDEEEIIGKKIHPLIHRHDNDLQNLHDKDCPLYYKYQNEEVLKIENDHFWRKSNDYFPAEYICTPMRKSGIIVGAVITFNDITERVQAQTRLQQKTAELEKVNQQLTQTNVELEQFAYVTSHDLKAPLRAIENLATWIEEDAWEKLDANSRENLQLLRKRVNRMSHLIGGILHYSRAGKMTMEIEEVNLNELINEVVDSIAPPKSFTIDLPKSLPTFTTARTPISQIFSNLISNSIKYHDRSDGRIAVSVKDHNDFFEFTVEDDGPGISPDYHQKIFQIFQTLQSRDKIESTGIGLTVVKKIVESVGGAVTVDSDIGKGSRFIFTWPKKLLQGEDRSAR